MRESKPDGQKIMRSNCCELWECETVRIEYDGDKHIPAH